MELHGHAIEKWRIRHERADQLRLGVGAKRVASLRACKGNTRHVEGGWRGGAEEKADPESEEGDVDKEEVRVGTFCSPSGLAALRGELRQLMVPAPRGDGTFHTELMHMRTH